MNRFLLSIDQGTTSSRVMLFDDTGTARCTLQEELTQHYPADGWVEHDPEEIWTTTLAVARQAVDTARALDGQVVAIGIANQRETTVAWDRRTGRPVHNAIVWQDRRTAAHCDRLRAQGMEETVTARTGLLLDPYFSATKLTWILEHVEDAAALAERGELAFGTVDTFLIWRLTGGRVHATDATNASRTMLFDIHRQCWDEELTAAFGVPLACLPEVRDSAADFGVTDAALLGRAIPITGVAGDQQAAAIGQACLQPGMIKSTYGTGCFVLLNTGDTPIASRNRLLTTVAYRLAGRTSYALEGSIFVAGAAVQWLRDQLGIITSAPETEALAAGLDDNGGVYLVPAFTGLGAPHWDPAARGALFGLTRDTGVAHLARAALEAVCYQTADLLEAMASDGVRPSRLRVDGGMVGNDWLCQFLADVLRVPVERPGQTETTALGAAYLAGLQCGVFESTQMLEEKWTADTAFEPAADGRQSERLLAGWRRAVDRARGRARSDVPGGS